MLRARVEEIDHTGSRGVGALSVQLTEVIKDVADVQRQLTEFRREHKRQHDHADQVREEGARRRERQRRETRRYWVATIAVVVTSNLGTILILAATRHG